MTAVEQAGTGESTGEGTHEGKRVSWVELYFDLIFVFAVSQVAHQMVSEPRWGGVLAALGVFAALWWTWIGFVVLYNRRGDDRLATSRLVMLAGTVPCAIAATQAHHVFEGHATGFALALAGARVVLVVAYLIARSRQAALGFGLSAIVFAISAVAHDRWVYILWGYAIIQEGALLTMRRRPRESHRSRGRTPAGRRPQDPDRREEALRAQFVPPADREHALDPAHLAERFGLFMIILLGEIMISVGSAALERPDQDLAYWLTLTGGLVLAAALWWIYFNSAATINERLLKASGGNPQLANTIYAGGHLMPAFSLLVIAAGVSLSLDEDPPAAASWLVTGGLAAYLAGTRALSLMHRHWYSGILRLLVLAATVGIALLEHVLIQPAVVAVAAAWAVGTAAVVSAYQRDTLKQLGDDPLAFLRRR